MDDSIWVVDAWGFGNTSDLYKFAKSYMYDVVTGEKILDIKHITADDYLLAIGAKHFTRSHSLPQEKEYDAICFLSLIKR